MRAWIHNYTGHTGCSVKGDTLTVVVNQEMGIQRVGYSDAGALDNKQNHKRQLSKRNLGAENSVKLSWRTKCTSRPKLSWR